MNASIRPSGGAVTQFPMMPEKITLGADAKFMTYSIISLGDVKIPEATGIFAFEAGNVNAVVYTGSCYQQFTNGSIVSVLLHSFNQRIGINPR